MDWKIRAPGHRPRVAILVSKYDHCLVDLLWRWRKGDLTPTSRRSISNHPDLGPEAAVLDLPFHHVPVERGAKAAAEERMLGLLAGTTDLVILARYMQILSGDFLERVGAR